MAVPVAKGFSPVCLISARAPHHDGVARPPGSFWSALRAHLPPLPWLIPCHETSVWTWMALLPFAPVHCLHRRLRGKMFQMMPTPSISPSSHPPTSEANWPIGRSGRPPCPKPSLTPCQSRPCLCSTSMYLFSCESQSHQRPFHQLQVSFSSSPASSGSKWNAWAGSCWGDGTFRTSLVCLALKAGAERISSVALWAPFQMDCPCSFTCFSSTPLRPVRPAPCSEVFTSTATGLGGGGGKAGKMSPRDGSFGGKVEATGEASFSRIRMDPSHPWRPGCASDPNPRCASPSPRPSETARALRCLYAKIRSSAPSRKAGSPTVPSRWPSRSSESSCAKPCNALLLIAFVWFCRLFCSKSKCNDDNLSWLMIVDLDMLGAYLWTFWLENLPLVAAEQCESPLKMWGTQDITKNCDMNRTYRKKRGNKESSSCHSIQI